MARNSGVESLDLSGCGRPLLVAGAARVAYLLNLCGSAAGVKVVAERSGVDAVLLAEWAVMVEGYHHGHLGHYDAECESIDFGESQSGGAILKTFP